MMRTRTICVGTLYRDGFLARNGQLTSRKCLTLTWRGGVDWCQPCQFTDETQMRKAVSHRLSMAGLRLVNLALWWPQDDPGAEYDEVWCTVQRSGDRHSRAVLVNRMRQRRAQGTEGAGVCKSHEVK